MSRAFTGSSSGSFAQVDKPAKLGPPFTVSLWFRTPQPARTGYLFWLGRRSSELDWFAVSMLNGRLRAETRATAGTAWGIAVSGNNIAANVAQHACATFTSTTAREIILNGDTGNKGTNSTSATPISPDRTAIGRASDASPTGGVLADIEHVAIWGRALTDAEKAALAQGANPLSIPGLIEYWPLSGAANPEAGLMGTDLHMQVTGAVKSSFTAPVQAPPSGGGSAGLPFDPANLVASSPVWPSLTITYGFPDVGFVYAEDNTGGRLDGLPGTVDYADGWYPLHDDAKDAIRAGAAALSSIGFNLQEVPASSAEILVAFSPQVDRTYADAIGNYPPQGNIFFGPDKPAEEADLEKTWGVGGWRRRVATHELMHTLGLTHATAPGASHSNSLMAVNPTPPAGAEPYVTAPYPVDVAALKLRYPALTGAAVGGRLSVAGASVAALGSGNPGKAMVLAVTFDPDAKKIQVRTDGGSPIEVAWTGDEDPTAGDLILGARLVNGVPQAGANFRMLRMLSSIELLETADQARAEQWAAEPLAPVCTPIVLSGTPGATTTIDLAPAVRDPAGWGWKIIAIDQPPEGSVSALDETRISLNLTGANSPILEFGVQVASKHPMGPSSPLRISVRLSEVTLPGVSVDVAKNGTALIDVLAGATAEDGSALTLVSVSDPEHGTAAIQSGQVRYTPDSNYTGSDSFIFTARSRTGGIATGTALLTVNVGEVPVGGNADRPFNGLYYGCGSYGSRIGNVNVYANNGGKRIAAGTFFAYRPGKIRSISVNTRGNPTRLTSGGRDYGNGLCTAWVELRPVKPDGTPDMSVLLGRTPNFTPRDHLNQHPHFNLLEPVTIPEGGKWLALVYQILETNSSGQDYWDHCWNLNCLIRTKPIAGRMPPFFSGMRVFVSDNLGSSWREFRNSKQSAEWAGSYCWFGELVYTDGHAIGQPYRFANLTPKRVDGTRYRVRQLWQMPNWAFTAQGVWIRTFAQSSNPELQIQIAQIGGSVLKTIVVPSSSLQQFSDQYTPGQIIHGSTDYAPDENTATPIPPLYVPFGGNVTFAAGARYSITFTANAGAKLWFWPVYSGTKAGTYTAVDCFGADKNNTKCQFMDDGSAWSEWSVPAGSAPYNDLPCLFKAA
ncbi:MAG TPA: LamG-like jellyroll fold domain-containing protein [Geminicoccus sp.]|uniref:Ig-like domain-containing protein n=1 Tax=Geminicoccus sp. TaxID=2024832 RepID=UPI002BB7FC11|nr:LamG-like jellyroll fold domain-containing protein [Geminicoccus sp.]HWL67129.1 LamG-like jellyroll fold domain-containing protein [Geminicoccus sp.]